MKLTKKKKTILFSIIVLFLMVIYFIFNKYSSNSIAENNYKNDKVQIEKDVFYYNYIAYEIFCEIHEGYSQKEILQNIYDFGYSRYDALQIIEEYKVDWENHKITNFDSTYYKQMVLDGMIEPYESEMSNTKPDSNLPSVNLTN